VTKNPIIAGIDEAGRGALAGPVVAGACILGDAKPHPLLRDSKKLTEQQREEVYEWIISHCTWGVGIVSAQEVDAIRILSATEKAMQEAVAQVATTTVPTYLIIDGRDKFWFDYPHSSVIKGDEKELCISAGSIVAKVTRDRMMVELSKKFPTYGFEVHKGYGTPEHIAALQKHGTCPLHRETFLTNILQKA